MRRVQQVRLGLLVLGLSIGVAAQTNSAPPEPAPAFGQTAPILSPEMPPVTGLDEPALDLRTATRSFISPALQVSESGDTNGANTLGGNQLQSVSRVIGAFDLQQFWPKSDLFLEYLGGGAFYTRPYEARQLQAAGLEGVTRWRTGQATLRDSFSYLPDGAFQIGFGGNPGLGLATGGGLGTGVAGIHAFGGGQEGAVGNIPRLTNTAILEAVQAINPISAVTVAGGFSNAHFFDSYNAVTNPDPLIDSDQLTVEGGYAHLLNRHDQIGAIYAFQLFQFPQLSGGQIYIHIINIRYSHTITGRLSVVAGAGPQYTELEQGGYSSRWSLSARVQLRYKFSHSELLASYEKFTSPGSGFFAGANVQEARVGYTRPVGRTWTLYGDLGYSHNAQIQSVSGYGVVGANTYDEGSAGFVLRKHLGRNYDVFGAYRFAELGFSNEVTFLGSTGRIESRQVGTVGLEWHPRPTRIE